MGKTQKSISVPKEEMEEITQLYRQHKQDYKKLGITSESKLVMVMANLGKQQLTQILELVSKLSETQIAATREMLGAFDKPHNSKRESFHKP